MLASSKNLQIMIFRTLSSLLLLLAIAGCSSHAQVTERGDRTITISMSASEILPADLIIFTINVNAEAGSPQQAFQMHQQKEGILAGLLKEFDIEVEHIRFQPVQINRGMNSQREQVVRTSQQVSVSFSDFDLYERIQLKLIENGFNSFNGSFSSSEMEIGKEKALMAAIRAAKDKAGLIAETSGVTLGEIRTINYSDFKVIREVRTQSMAFNASGSSLMDFDQTVEVTANIEISFSISD